MGRGGEGGACQRRVPSAWPRRSELNVSVRRTPSCMGPGVAWLGARVRGGSNGKVQRVAGQRHAHVLMSPLGKYASGCASATNSVCGSLSYLCRSSAAQRDRPMSPRAHIPRHPAPRTGDTDCHAWATVQWRQEPPLIVQVLVRPLTHHRGPCCRHSNREACDPYPGRRSGATHCRRSVTHWHRTVRTGTVHWYLFNTPTTTAGSAARSTTRTTAPRSCRFG